jgi:hypothetical protein
MAELSNAGSLQIFGNILVNTTAAFLLNGDSECVKHCTMVLKQTLAQVANRFGSWENMKSKACFNWLDKRVKAVARHVERWPLTASASI